MLMLYPCHLRKKYGRESRLSRLDGAEDQEVVVGVRALVRRVLCDQDDVVD